MHLFKYFVINLNMDIYHILHPIGEGAFGKVSKGRRKHSG
jgi:hypothetical protein